VPRYPQQRGRRRCRFEVIQWIGHVRSELCYGATRIRLWLQRVHHARLAMGTIQRIFRDLGMPRLRRTRKRPPRRLKLFEKAERGESPQVDVKFVKIGDPTVARSDSRSLSSKRRGFDTATFDQEDSGTPEFPGLRVGRDGALCREHATIRPASNPGPHTRRQTDGLHPSPAAT
jgi:hypothetical protein